MGNLKKLKFFGMVSILAAVIFIASCLALFVVYVLTSWYEKDNPPADFDIAIPKNIQQGQEFTYDVQNLVRHKLCPYRRFVTITDKDGKLQNMQEVPGYPQPLYGNNPDIFINMKLDPRLSPGPAFMDVLVEYTCPGNFFHAVLNEPFLSRRHIPFTITAKQE